MLDKFAVAAALRELGTLMEFLGENAFKVRAYEAGAAAVEELTEDLGLLVDEKRLTEVRGIGAALAARIAELYLTGRCAALEEMRLLAPRGIPDLLRVPDLGPKKLAALHKALAIDSVADLKAACEAGRVRGIKGFGEKTERKILDGIARLEAQAQAGQRLLLVDALALGERLRAHLGGCPAALRVELTGALRRGEETVAEVALVAAVAAGEAAQEAADGEAVLAQLERFPSCAEVLHRGPRHLRARLGDGTKVELTVASTGHFAAALLLTTAAPAHLAGLRCAAEERGLTLHLGDGAGDGAGDALGLRRGGAEVPAASEEALYAALGLPPFPPELREGQGELEAAREGRLPEDLVTLGDIRGMVHCHSTYSDGKNSILEMARGAEALGMSYLTITDHSQSAFYAGGVKVEALPSQWEEIARAQEQVRVRLLRGAEVDILADGALDYPDEILAQLDVVIASIHSRMKMDEEQMTRRLVAAMRRPVFKIWGHALGRLLQQRPPFACRVEEVLDAIAGSRAAIEVNGDPNRLDMEPRWIRKARERGIPFVISTDAHSIAGMGNLPFGVTTARRGWLRRGEVLNTLSADAFCAAVRPAG